jgi:hypothetical protein
MFTLPALSIPAQEVPAMFKRKAFKRKMFSRCATAKLALGALFAALCVLPACSIDAQRQRQEMATRMLTSSLP